MPPVELRKLVGLTDADAFDNPDRSLVFPWIPKPNYETVFDFGCGCGRLARQLLQQRSRPKRYVGVDINREMVGWCQKNLSPVDQNFRFQHHDVRSASMAPDNSDRLTAPFEVEDSAFTLALAVSVFTHLREDQALHYLREIARILRSDGLFVSTWFLFDKRDFPMMQPFQNALFINEKDPTNAIILDRGWLDRALEECGLYVVRVDPPEIRGFHWWLTMRPRRSGDGPLELPPDTAPRGSMPSPLVRR